MRIILKHTASASTETIKSNIEIGELAIKHPVGGGASILTKDNNGDLTEFPSTVRIAALIRNEEATHGTRFGGFIDPETDFNTLDKEKFYCGLSRGGYNNNNLWVYNNRCATFRYNKGTGWQISMICRTAPPKRQHIINKAVSINSPRYMNIYYFRGTMSIKIPDLQRLVTKNGTYRRFRFLGDNGNVNQIYSLFISRKIQDQLQTIYSTIPDNPDSTDFYALAEEALDVMQENLRVEENLTIPKMESPYVTIINGKVIRTTPCFIPEISFKANNDQTMISQITSAVKNHLITYYYTNQCKHRSDYSKEWGTTYFLAKERRYLSNKCPFARRSFVRMRRAKFTMRVIGHWKKKIWGYSRLSSIVNSYRISYVTNDRSTYGIHRC